MKKKAMRRTNTNQRKAAASENPARGVTQETQSSSPCPPYEEDYCAYYYSGGQWWPVGSHTPSGYYCPSTIGTSYETRDGGGDYECISPIPMTSSEALVASKSDGLHCTYHYERGRFYLTAGRCSDDRYCPGDLIEFAKDHPELRSLVTSLLSNPQIESATVRIEPRSIASCQISGHAPPHDAS